MNLTSEQIEAAKRGVAVEFDAQDVKLTLIRSDMLGRLEDILPPEIVSRVVDSGMEEYDADDQLLDSYQRFKR